MTLHLTVYGVCRVMGERGVARRHRPSQSSPAMFEAAVQRCRRPLRDVDKRQLLPPHDPQVAHSKATALALCFASGSMSANCPM